MKILIKECEEQKCSAAYIHFLYSLIYEITALIYNFKCFTTLKIL